MSTTATVRHVADADDCREPFDWSTHATGDDIAECWCGPYVEHDTSETESDDSYRQRLVDSYGMWGALVTEMIESNGSGLDVIGTVLNPPVVRGGVEVVVCHRRPIEYDIVTGEPRAEDRL